MEFTSQICSNKEQSEKLLASGLKQETADCQHWAYTKDSRGRVITKRNQRWFTRIGTDESVMVCGFMSASFIPAWSLDRLLEMIPDVITVEDAEYNFVMLNKISFQYENIDLNKVLASFNDESLYESIIECIIWLIKTRLFNKKFLNE